MGKKQKTNGGDAVIYARYSSHNQRDVSIEQQVEACRKHAAELGLTVTATYEDRAISGKTDKRPNTENRSYAQLTPDEKDAISHRGNALAELEKQLPSFLGE